MLQRGIIPNERQFCNVHVLSPAMTVRGLFLNTILIKLINCKNRFNAFILKHFSHIYMMKNARTVSKNVLK